jgi:Tfp pilus assembly major pilin PilA
MVGRNGMHKPINTPPRGITWLEVLVLLALIGILASLAIPSVYIGASKAQMTGPLSHMRILYLATKQFTLDNEPSNNPVRWTCSNTTPLTLDQWMKALSPRYLSEAELKKLLSVTEERKFIGTKTIDEAINVFAVTKDDPEDTVLFATKNWHGPKVNELSGEPYGTRAFVVYRKGGDGQVLLQRQITNMSLIGGGGMHNYLPLK